MTKQDLLNRFKESNEYFNKRLTHCNSFDDIVFTTKSDLIENQTIFPPFGNFLDRTFQIHQIYRTSGTTSLPLLLAFSENDIDFISGIGAECFIYSRMGEFGNDEVVFNCLNLSMWAGGFFDSQSMFKTGVQVVNFGTGNTAELIKLILIFSKKYKVSVHCTPSYLPLLEKKLIDEFSLCPAELKIHSFYLGAEGGLHNNNFRNSLIEKWQSNIFNANYGMSEVCSIMASANDENQLKFANKFINSYFLELIKDSSEIIPYENFVSGDVGDLVVTSVYKECQPILRYNTKERIKILKIEQDNCFFEVLGRSDDMVVFKGINVFPEQFREIISSIPELTGFYKVIAFEKSRIIVDLILKCEIRKEFVNSKTSIKQLIINRIKDEYSLKLKIDFFDSFDLKGNKVKILEKIKI